MDISPDFSRGGETEGPEGTLLTLSFFDRNFEERTVAVPTVPKNLWVNRGKSDLI